MTQEDLIFSAEVLVGFDVTPQMADFNRQGKRFRLNVGQAGPAGPEQQPKWAT